MTNNALQDLYRETMGAIQEEDRLEKLHERRARPLSDDQAFECSACGYRTSNRGNIYRHIRHRSSCQYHEAKPIRLRAYADIPRKKR